MTDYIVLFLGWSFYLFIHSFLASNEIKKEVGWSEKNYRLFYSILSVIGLFVLLYLMAIAPPKYFYVPNDAIKYVGMVLASWGVIIIMRAFKQLSIKEFIGLRSPQDSELITTGLHGRMRHPIYTGTILLILGMFVSVPSWSVMTCAIAIFIYLPIGIHYEEKKLIAHFGDEYLKYKKEVACIIPGLI